MVKICAKGDGDLETPRPASDAIGPIIKAWQLQSLANVDLSDLWRRVNAVDWSKKDFSLDKAYVCSLFSYLAYLRVADFELADANRVNVIPCYAYQNIVRTGQIFDFDGFLRSGDFGEFFVIIRRYVIIIGIRTPNVIFVSMRGTKYLYDWLVNINSSKYRHDGDGGVSSFHRGFFRAIVPCFEPISIELDKYLSKNPIPIYVTGHSLGGAIAAIMHALWGMTISSRYVQEGIVHNLLRAHSCFTYGMPRYGDFNVIAKYRSPYHLYNEKDIVPTVPPRWLGFESCGSEYKVDGTAIEQLSRRESFKFMNWIYNLVSGRGISDHAIEEYRSRILNVLDAKSSEST